MDVNPPNTSDEDNFRKPAKMSKSQLSGHICSWGDLPYDVVSVVASWTGVWTILTKLSLVDKQCSTLRAYKPLYRVAYAVQWGLPVRALDETLDWRQKSVERLRGDAGQLSPFGQTFALRFDQAYQLAIKDPLKNQAQLEQLAQALTEAYHQLLWRLRVDAGVKEWFVLSASSPAHVNDIGASERLKRVAMLRDNVHLVQYQLDNQRILGDDPGVDRRGVAHLTIYGADGLPIPLRYRHRWGDCEHRDDMDRSLELWRDEKPLVSWVMADENTTSYFIDRPALLQLLVDVYGADMADQIEVGTYVQYLLVHGCMINRWPYMPQPLTHYALSRPLKMLLAALESPEKAPPAELCRPNGPAPPPVDQARLATWTKFLSFGGDTKPGWRLFHRVDEPVQNAYNEKVSRLLDWKYLRFPRAPRPPAFPGLEQLHESLRLVEASKDVDEQSMGARVSDHHSSILRLTAPLTPVVKMARFGAVLGKRMADWFALASLQPSRHQPTVNRLKEWWSTVQIVPVTVGNEKERGSNARTRSDLWIITPAAKPALLTVLSSASTREQWGSNDLKIAVDHKVIIDVDIQAELRLMNVGKQCGVGDAGLWAELVQRVFGSGYTFASPAAAAEAVRWVVDLNSIVVHWKTAQHTTFFSSDPHNSHQTLLAVAVNTTQVAADPNQPKRPKARVYGAPPEANDEEESVHTPKQSFSFGGFSGGGGGGGGGGPWFGGPFGSSKPWRSSSSSAASSAPIELPPGVLKSDPTIMTGSPIVCRNGPWVFFDGGRIFADFTKWPPVVRPTLVFVEHAICEPSSGRFIGEIIQKVRDSPNSFHSSRVAYNLENFPPPAPGHLSPANASVTPEFTVFPTLTPANALIIQANWGSNGTPLGLLDGCLVATIGNADPRIQSAPGSKTFLPFEGAPDNGNDRDFLLSCFLNRQVPVSFFPLPTLTTDGKPRPLDPLAQQGIVIRGRLFGVVGRNRLVDLSVVDELSKAPASVSTINSKQSFGPYVGRTAFVVFRGRVFGLVGTELAEFLWSPTLPNTIIKRPHLTGMAFDPEAPLDNHADEFVQIGKTLFLPGPLGCGAEDKCLLNASPALIAPGLDLEKNENPFFTYNPERQLLITLAKTSNDDRLPGQKLPEPDKEQQEAVACCGCNSSVVANWSAEIRTGLDGPTKRYHLCERCYTNMPPQRKSQAEWIKDNTKKEPVKEFADDGTVRFYAAPMKSILANPNWTLASKVIDLEKYQRETKYELFKPSRPEGFLRRDLDPNVVRIGLLYTLRRPFLEYSIVSLWEAQPNTAPACLLSPSVKRFSSASEMIASNMGGVALIGNQDFNPSRAEPAMVLRVIEDFKDGRNVGDQGAIVVHHAARGGHSIHSIGFPEASFIGVLDFTPERGDEPDRQAYADALLTMWLSTRRGGGGFF